MKNRLSLEAFTDWVGMQPAEKEYDYSDHFGCVYFQYLKYVGLPVDGVGGTYWRDTNDMEHTLSMPLRMALRDPNRVFGALHSRLLEALNAQSN